MVVITVVAGANGEVRARQVPEAWLNADTVVLMQLEVPMGEVEALALRARRQGPTVILNAAPAMPVPETLWRTLDVLLVNESEADLLGRTAGQPGDPRVPLLQVLTLAVAAGSLACTRRGAQEAKKTPSSRHLDADVVESRLAVEFSPSTDCKR